MTHALPKLVTARSDPSVGETTRVAAADEIRAHFPALQRRQADMPVAYFDGPGGTQVPQAVVEEVTNYLTQHNANTHWNYPTSRETDEVLARARAALADFVGGVPEEIVFGANATSLAFHVSRALGRLFSAGDEIVVTELDHHANVGPWQALARERDCTLSVVRMDTRSGQLDWNDFEQKVNRRTKLVAVGAASNALGTINDVARATQLAHSVGAYAFVDAVHYAPHRLADARGWSCDFLVCSAYKFYGPHVGVLWCRRELLESLPFAKLLPAPDTGPDRAETGTQNHEGIAGAAAAVDFLATLTGTDKRTILAGMDRNAGLPEISGAVADGAVRPRMGRLYDRRQRLGMALHAIDERGEELTGRMWTGLSEIDGVSLFGPPPDVPRTSTVSFTVSGVASAEVARRLAERGVFVSHGNFYAATVVERLGLERDGLVRAGCACYTTADEVERLLAGVECIAR